MSGLKTTMCDLRNLRQAPVLGVAERNRIEEDVPTVVDFETALH
jgi:hypothetical protein